MAKKKSVHYVNNAKFSQAVVEFVDSVNKADEAGDERPVITNYIAECFMKISEGLSRKPQFISYSFREDMVLDAVENCIKAIGNYNIDAATRTGKPNAFSYFTTISYYAFLRRINKEKKQSEIKKKYMRTAGVSGYAYTSADASAAETSSIANYVDTLKSRADQWTHAADPTHDSSETVTTTEPKKRKKKLADSNLEGYIDD